MKIKNIFFGFFLFLSFLQSQNDPHFFYVPSQLYEVHIPANTPFFSIPEPFYKNLQFVSGQSMNLAVEDQGSYSIADIFGKGYTPLVRKIEMFFIKLPNGKKFWVSPNLEIEKRENQKEIQYRIIFRDFSKTKKQVTSICFFLIALFGCIWGFYKNPKRTILLLCICLILFQWSSLFFFSSIYGSFYSGWVDGQEYVAIAEKLWNLEKPPLYGKPIGFPLILTPFVGYFQNANIFLMGDIISTINSFIINTGSILLLFGIALYITKKNAISFGIACIYYNAMGIYYLSGGRTSIIRIFELFSTIFRIFYFSYI